MFLTDREQYGPGGASPDRNYPISAHVEYRLKNGDVVLSAGTGRTKTISTSSVLLESEPCLPVGVVVELDVTWPVRVDDRAEMDLHILGRTIRVDGNQTTISILRHQFRTRSASATDATTQSSAAGGDRTMTASAT